MLQAWDMIVFQPQNMIMLAGLERDRDPGLEHDHIPIPKHDNVSRPGK